MGKGEHKEKQHSSRDVKFELVQPKGNIKSMVVEADEYFRQGELDKGASAYFRIAENLEKNGHERQARDIYKRGGEILKRVGEYDLAAEMFRKAADYNNLAGVYLEAALNSRDHESKKKYAGKASEVYGKLHQTTREMAGIAGNLEDKAKKHEKYKIAAVTLASIGFLMAILSISSQMTGFVVAEQASNVSAFGALFFVIGIVIMLLYLRKKTKRY